jgi:hypothetical protein
LIHVVLRSNCVGIQFLHVVLECTIAEFEGPKVASTYNVAASHDDSFVRLGVAHRGNVVRSYDVAAWYDAIVITIGL